MELVLTVVAVLVALVVIVALVGSRLPAAHSARRSAELSASPDRVWSAINLAVRERWGGVSYEVVESVPPRRLVGKVVGSKDFGGTWTYEIDTQGNATRLTITEDGWIANPFFRFLSRYVFGYSRTIETYLTNLQQTLARE
jgi:hypothetical protein